MANDLWRRAAAEGLATFCLVAAGCGAIVVNALTGELNHMGITAVFGLIVMVMVAATGHLSGAHLNPAVTLAFTLTRHFPRREVPIYWAAQLLGATVAAFLLRLFFGDVANLGTTLPLGNALQSLGLEIFMTAILMFVIMAVATDTKAAGQLAAIMIGATVALNSAWGGPISGASLNPARSFGPALASSTWTDQWIYWVGPILGAALGAQAYQLVRERHDAPAQGVES